jgi:uncharacterized phage protein (TIGR02218 family)
VAAQKAYIYFGADMKQASPELIELLNSSEQFAMADLYTFMLVDGGIYNYSAGTTMLSANGVTFVLGPKFERSKTKTVIGVQVDELDVKIYPERTDLLGAVPWLQAAWTGQFDGALLQVERAFMWPNYGTIVGTVVLFAGRISEIDSSRTGIDMKCRSHIELLNIQMPRRLWQESCSHVFGDAMCQFNRASLAVAFPCAAGSTQTVINGAPSNGNPYLQGTIVGVSGANTGQTRTITGFQPGRTVTVKLAFLSTPAPGDQFEILPGCDRSLATCTNTFNNQNHFGGMPFIPAPENAV